MQVIAAEGEKKASQALRDAADTISESPAALQLRYLQVGWPENCQETLHRLIDLRLASEIKFPFNKIEKFVHLKRKSSICPVGLLYTESHFKTSWKSTKRFFIS